MREGYPATSRLAGPGEMPVLQRCGGACFVPLPCSEARRGTAGPTQVRATATQTRWADSAGGNDDMPGTTRGPTQEGSPILPGPFGTSQDRALPEEGHCIRTVAKLAKLSRNTVRRILRGTPRKRDLEKRGCRRLHRQRPMKRISDHAGTLFGRPFPSSSERTWGPNGRFSQVIGITAKTRRLVLKSVQ